MISRSYCVERLTGADYVPQIVTEGEVIHYGGCWARSKGGGAWVLHYGNYVAEIHLGRDRRAAAISLEVVIDFLRAKGVPEREVAV